MPAPSCRLFVILAREAPRAVIFRRGPTRQVQQILWHTDTDRFEPGQWLKGRLYERRCDLSPDGTLLIYFAAKHTGPKYSWTAISKPPYFTALALWKKGDCWDGGGLFDIADFFWLNHPEMQSKITQGSLAPGFQFRHNGTRCFGEDEPIYAARLMRDGWPMYQKLITEPVKEPHQPVPPAIFARLHESTDPRDIDLARQLAELESHQPKEHIIGFRTLQSEIQRKVAGDGRTLICERLLVRFRTIEHYSLELATGRPIPLVGATWADFDQRARIVFARDGKLYSADPGPDAVIERELADLNSAKFEPVPPPEWAQSW